MYQSTYNSQSIKELEATLASKKQEESKRALVTKYLDLKSRFQNKCFSSNTITKRSGSTYLSLIHYVNFYMNEEDNIFVEEKSIYIQSNRYTPKTWGLNSRFNSDCSWTTRQLTSSYKELSAFNTIYPSYQDFRYPISLSSFNHIWNASLETYATFRQAFKSTISIPETEYISQADAASEEKVSDSISRLNNKIPSIDLKDYPEVYEILNTADIPFLSHGRWLPQYIASTVLKDYCNQLDKQLKQGYSPQYLSYIQYKIDTIESFIQTILWKMD